MAFVELELWVCKDHGGGGGDPAIPPFWAYISPFPQQSNSDIPLQSTQEKTSLHLNALKLCGKKKYNKENTEMAQEIIERIRPYTRQPGAFAEI